MREKSRSASGVGISKVIRVAENATASRLFVLKTMDGSKRVGLMSTRKAGAASFGKSNPGRELLPRRESGGGVSLVKGCSEKRPK